MTLARAAVPVLLALAVLGMAHAPLREEGMMAPPGMTYLVVGPRDAVLVPISFGWWAASVIPCESSWDATKTGAAGERGLMQLHPVQRERIERLGYTWDQMYEPKPNIMVALDLYLAEGSRPWACSNKPEVPYVPRTLEGARAELNARGYFYVEGRGWVLDKLDDARGRYGNPK